jgi:predicted Zn-dependent protease
METLATGALLGAGAGYALGGSDNGVSYAEQGASVGAAGGQFFNMGFTRKDEAQADQFGFLFYSHAGWDPNHFGDFFQHMIDLGYDKTPGYMSDHPTLASRVQAAKEHDKELPANASQWRRNPIANDAHFHELQQRAVALSKTTPDDSTLQSSQKLLQALPRSCIAPVDPDDAIQARKELAQKAQQKQGQ